MIESGLSGQGSWLWMDGGGSTPGTSVLCAMLAVCRWLPDSVVELARGASGGVHSRIRVSRKMSISDAVH